MPQGAVTPEQRWYRLCLRAFYWQDLLLRSTLMLALRGRVAPKSAGSKAEVTDQQAKCPHPPSSVRGGGNQWATWKTCKKCGVRLDYQSKDRAQGKKEASQKSSSSRPGRGSAKEEPTKGKEADLPSPSPPTSEGLSKETIGQIAEAMGKALQAPLADLAASQQLIVNSIAQSACHSASLMAQAHQASMQQMERHMAELSRAMGLAPVTEAMTVDSPLEVPVHIGEQESSEWTEAAFPDAGA